MAEQLRIETLSPSPDHQVLKLTGALVLTTVFDFQQVVRADTSAALTIDLTDVPYVDSAGIGALVNAHISHTKNGRKFALAGVSQRVMQVLQITKVDSLFTVEPSTKSASASD